MAGGVRTMRQRLRQAQISWLHAKTVREAAPPGQRRRAAAAGLTLLAMRRGFTGPRPRLCQWIEGEPSGDDSCKCLVPVEPGRPYCAAHWARAWRPADKVEA